MKLRIAVLGVIIIGVILTRYVLTRIDSVYQDIENGRRVMYIVDSAGVRIQPEDNADVLYRLYHGDSVEIRRFNPLWNEIISGGFIADSVLSDLRPE